MGHLSIFSSCQTNASHMTGRLSALECPPESGQKQGRARHGIQETSCNPHQPSHSDERPLWKRCLCNYSGWWILLSNQLRKSIERKKSEQEVIWKQTWTSQFLVDQLWPLLGMTLSVSWGIASWHDWTSSVFCLHVSSCLLRRFPGLHFAVPFPLNFSEWSTAFQCHVLVRHA